MKRPQAVNLELEDLADFYGKESKTESYITKLEQECDRLKDRLYNYGCEDVDIIRCLKTLAYEHNHSDVPRYKDLAKRTMEKYVERHTNVGSDLAEHDAEVIERFLVTEAPRIDAGEPNPIDPEIHHCEWTLHQERERLHAAANQLRQQAKEAQS